MMSANSAGEGSRPGVSSTAAASDASSRHPTRGRAAVRSAFSDYAARREQARRRVPIIHARQVCNDTLAVAPALHQVVLDHRQPEGHVLQDLVHRGLVVERVERIGSHPDIQ